MIKCAKNLTKCDENVEQIILDKKENDILNMKLYLIHIELYWILFNHKYNNYLIFFNFFETYKINIKIVYLMNL